MNEPAIEIKGLSKSFGRVRAVDGLDLSVRSGVVHGFLGPNGAGKTTVIRVLLGLTMPDEADIKVFGLDLFERRLEIMRGVGAVVESPVFFDYFSARENLRWLAEFSGGCDCVRINEVLDVVGLSDAADRLVGGFSYGMRQRLGIAQALLPMNKLIFLDEPTNGLDPHGIMDVRRLLRRLAEDFGVTVFLSSHLLAEVEQTCDEVTIINFGRKVREASVDDLVGRRQSLVLRTPNGAEFAEFAVERGLRFNRNLENAEFAEFIFDGSEDDAPELARELVANGIDIRRLTVHENSLEDIFVELTGNA